MNWKKTLNPSPPTLTTFCELSTDLTWMWWITKDEELMNMSSPSGFQITRVSVNCINYRKPDSVSYLFWYDWTWYNFGISLSFFSYKEVYHFQLWVLPFLIIIGCNSFPLCLWHSQNFMKISISTFIYQKFYTSFSNLTIKIFDGSMELKSSVVNPLHHDFN